MVVFHILDDKCIQKCFGGSKYASSVPRVCCGKCVFPGIWFILIVLPLKFWEQNQRHTFVAVQFNHRYLLSDLFFWLILFCSFLLTASSMSSPARGKVIVCQILEALKHYVSRRLYNLIHLSLISFCEYVRAPVGKITWTVIGYSIMITTASLERGCQKQCIHCAWRPQFERIIHKNDKT